MDQKRAILLLNDSDPLEGHGKPLMLKAVLFSPILTWVSEKLRADGVRRFFVACAPEYEEEVRACFREEDSVTVSGDREDLRAFLEEDGEVSVIPSPVLPVGDDIQPDENRAFTASAAALRKSWEDTGSGKVEGASPLQGFAAAESLSDAQELALLSRDWLVDRLTAQGAEFVDRYAVYVSPRVEIGEGTVVLPGTILRGKTVIGKDCTIGPQAVVDDSTVGDGVTINASQVQRSALADGCDVGPYAHIRPNCTVGAKCHVGAFVQLKNCVLGAGTKLSHLTYVGDADVGEGVNFGCGTITSNYDGFRKHRTVIGDHVFVGCNTNLIAPVTVGDGAYIAAGSTVTDTVPSGALAIGRSRQENKEGWADRRREQRNQN